MHQPVLFKWFTFSDMGVDRLYDLMSLRQRVFVVEQTSVYLDADGLDREAVHLLGCDCDESLVASLRILAPGVRYTEPSIGRVVVAPEARSIGLGRELMGLGIERCTAMFPNRGIRISAQEYLLGFYSSMGFVAEGEGYLEDGIPHVGMAFPSPADPGIIDKAEAK